jgi:hypothetical protein
MHMQVRTRWCVSVCVPCVADLGSWLADPSKGGAMDDLLNVKGLSPYDGI